MIQEFPTGMKRRHKLMIIAGAVLIVFLLSLSGIVTFLTDIEWFKAVGYDDVFWTTFAAKVTLWGIAFGAGIVLAMLNHFLGLGTASRKSTLNQLGKKVLFWGGLAFAVLLPVIFAFMFQGQYWEEYLKAIHSGTMGTVDPIFNQDISYYMFRRPFYMGLASSLMSYVIIISVVTIGLYLATRMLPQNRIARVHTGILISIILLIGAAIQKFNVEGILFSERGRVFGAGYTDVNVTLPYYWILMGILVLSAILTLVFSIRKRFSRWVFSGLGLYIIVVIMGGIASGVVQNFVVAPNEITREYDYISYNIEYTRQAYGLDNIVEKNFPVENTLTRDMIERNSPTINNIRINDPQAALETYNQLQGLRQYYRYNDIDIDRYMIDGKLTQVFISARELDKTRVSNQTHVNMMYKYTHGIGVSVNAVNEITHDGQPRFIVGDIPPVSQHEELHIEQPRIYYGEITNDSVIVRTTIPEFDYPAGETNVENFYEGTGGVSLGGINRLLFALREGNFRMLFSGYITGESRIMMHRNISRRVREIAPFLLYDNDPYIVIADGRLKWIIDAYTISSGYPYSEPVDYRGRTINYIRNPVKVVVDAYDGTVDFYVVEPEEPFIKVYNSIYPNLFKSVEEMPESLRGHIRYPEDLFNIQTQRYLRYHMSDINVFYNEEDLWQVAREKYAADEREMDPYYILMNLPGEESEEFILMRPFTPRNRHNAIAWMAARNDGENYGELILYRFSKQELVYGPMQIENRIDQDRTITSELTLLDQRGSSVIRGNMMMIPIEDTILYVEPLYIRADTQTALPEVKAVIVGYRDRIVMEDTLEQALERLFTGTVGVDREPRDDMSIDELIERAVEYMERSKEASGKGNWTEFGKMLQELENVIKSLEKQQN